MKKDIIKKILLYIIIFLSVLSIIILKPLSDFDEIWNYNFARNISNGLVPYRDFNMIITPLLSFICGIFLKIIADELIIMRIFAALLCSAILFITYKILGILKIRKELSIIFTFLIGYLFSDIFCIDYNYGSLFVVLLIIYYELKWYMVEEKLVKNIIKQDIILGILAGITITVKQTVGICVSIVLLGNKLLFIRSKDDFKIYLKSFIYRLLGIIVPSLLLILYLLLNNAFLDCISYTVSGVHGFTNYISYKELIDWNLLGIISILVPIAFIYGWIKTVVLEKDKRMYIILVYGLAIFSVCFPISNKIHFLIGSLPMIIAILYEINGFISKINISSNKIKNLFNWILITESCIIILFLIYYSFINIYNYVVSINETSKLKHYKYIPIDKDLENEINIVDNYIKESNADIKILDASAAIYMIPIDRYNKNYDMFNKGNLGKNGEERIIKEINESINTKYLILNDKYNKNWQTPLEVIDFIKERKVKKEQIEIFDVYK